MGRNARIDNEYRSFLHEYVESGVFPERSQEARIIRLVAQNGLEALTFEQREIWYGTVLPILSKPMAEQIAVSRIVRAGGRMPPSEKRQTESSAHPFAPVEDSDLFADMPATDHEALLQMARKLRASG